MLAHSHTFLRSFGRCASYTRSTGGVILQLVASNPQTGSLYFDDTDKLRCKSLLGRPRRRCLNSSAHMHYARQPTLTCREPSSSSKRRPCWLTTDLHAAPEVQATRDGLPQGSRSRRKALSGKSRTFSIPTKATIPAEPAARVAIC